jgi:hypothetical protein
MPNEQTPLLNEFLQHFTELPTAIIEGAIKASDNEDERAIIDAYAETLTNQFSELAAYITEKSEKLTEQQALDVEEVLKVTSGNTLVQAGKEYAMSIGSFIKKLGLSGLVKEIKKIILAILDALGIALPKWIEALINLIDEIIDRILGGNSPKLASILSQMEQDYLAELTQLAKLTKARAALQDQEENNNA